MHRITAQIGTVPDLHVAIRPGPDVHRLLDEIIRTTAATLDPREVLVAVIHAAPPVLHLGRAILLQPVQTAGIAVVDRVVDDVDADSFCVAPFESVGLS